MPDTFITRQTDGDIDRIYFLPQPDEATCLWLNTLSEVDYWEWIAAHATRMHDMNGGKA